MKYSKFTFVLFGLVIVGVAAFALFSTYSTETFMAPGSGEEELTSLPERLLIPSIGVDAPVQTVGLAEDSIDTMGVPDNFTDVGWYKYGPRPGMKGSSVITGHLNGKDIPEAVFFDLSQVEIGDEVIVIGEDSTSLTFRVVQVRAFPHNASTEEVFISNDGKVRLNLITCGGDWLSSEELYAERTVVFTELVTD